MVKKSISIICAVAMALMLFAGCASPTPAQTTVATANDTTPAPASSAEATPAPQAREEYSFKIYLPESSPNWNNDRLFKKVFEALNLKPEFISPAWGDQDSQLRTLIASDNMPDYCMTLMTPGTSDFASWVEQKLILDITDMVPNYPNLAKLMATDTFDQNKIDGKWYCIPRYFDGIVPHGLQIRQDWLDKLNLQVPTNMDELYAVLKAVVAADPDGQHTTGISVPHHWWLSHLKINFTGVNGWSKVNGRYVQDYTLDSYKVFLAYMAKLYSENLLDHDFMLGNADAGQQKLISGRAFMINFNIDPDIFNKTASGVEANFPGAKVAVIPPIGGPGGRYQFANMNDVFGVDIISAKAEKPDRILEMLDYLASDEGLKLATYGIEGVHYTTASDGTIQKNDAEYAADEVTNPAIWGRGLHWLRAVLDYYYTKELAPNSVRYDVLGPAYKMTHSYPPLRPVYTYNFTSQNNTDLSAGVNDAMNQWEIAFISGTANLDTQWNEYLEALNKAGYNKIEDDFNTWMTDHDK